MATVTDWFPSWCQGVFLATDVGPTTIQAVGQAIAGVNLANRNQKHIHALERYGDLQAVYQRIASIVREMRPNLMLDAPGNDHEGPDRRRCCAGVVDHRRPYGFAVWRSIRLPGRGF